MILLVQKYAQLMLSNPRKEGAYFSMLQNV